MMHGGKKAGKSDIRQKKLNFEFELWWKEMTSWERKELEKVSFDLDMMILG